MSSGCLGTRSCEPLAWGRDEVAAFDDVMGGSSPINGIESRNAETIRMSQGAGVECLGQVRVIVADATAIVLNSNSPPPFQQ